MIDPDAAIRVRHQRPHRPSSITPRASIKAKYSGVRPVVPLNPPNHRVHVWQQVCVCVCVRVCLRQKRRTVRVNHPLTIISDRLTRLVRVHMSAKWASWARSADHFHLFPPRTGCPPVGVELRVSPAACGAVDLTWLLLHGGKHTKTRLEMRNNPVYMLDNNTGCV